MSASLFVTAPIVDGVLVHAADVDAIVSTATIIGVGSGNGEIGAAAIQTGDTFGGVVGTASPGVPALRPLTSANRPISQMLVGLAQANQIFGRFTAEVATSIFRIELNAYGGAPTGQALIAGVQINGTPNAETATLGIGAPYSNTVLATPIAVPSGNTVDFYFTQVGTTYAGNFVQMTIYLSP
jgi:hypothetical protein